MPKIMYVDKQFQAKTVELITIANNIIREYMAQGFNLTLRQLYYQMVARDIIPNTQRSYKRLGSIINDARLAGWIDWNAIEDRTRNLRGLPHWGSPGSIMRSAANSYHRDLWEYQDYRVEVWIEKDALVGVIAGVCNELDVSFFACRGYVSQSEMWVAAGRFLEYEDEGKEVILLHLGDHDPSGMDMTRDIQDRLDMFGPYVVVKRIALNMDQVQQYNLPPNPTKLTDSRIYSYVGRYGRQSWELDALEPQVIVDLIRNHVEDVIDRELWEQATEREHEEKAQIAKIATHHDQVVKYLESLN